jgi:hypothetical protein
MTTDTSTMRTTGMDVTRSRTAIYTHTRSCSMPTLTILTSIITMSIDPTTSGYVVTSPGTPRVLGLPQEE